MPTSLLQFPMSVPSIGGIKYVCSDGVEGKRKDLLSTLHMSGLKGGLHLAESSKAENCFMVKRASIAAWPNVY